MKEWLQYAVILIVVSVFSFYLTGIFNPFVRYEVQVSVQASPENAWTAYSDAALMRKWMGGVEELNVISGDTLREGTSYRLILVQDGERYELMQTVVIFDRPRLIEYRVENDILINDMRVNFVPLDSGVVLTVKNKVAGKSFFWRAVFTIFKSILVEHQQEDYERFRDLVQQQ